MAEICLEAEICMILGDALTGPANPDPIKTLEIYKELALEDDGLSSGSRNTPVACFQLSGSQECRELL